MDAIGGASVSGSLYLYDSGSSVQIKGDLNGFPGTGSHGMAVHTYGVRSSLNTLGLGGHLNPGRGNHAASTTGGHMGDLGNVAAGAAGNGSIDITAPNLALTGPNSIVGRGISVAAGADSGNEAFGGQWNNALAACLIAVIDPGAIPGGLFPVTGADVSVAAASVKATGADCQLEQASAGGAGVSGTLRLSGLPGGGAWLEGTVTGLGASASHLLAIHEFGELGGTLGGHYNPTGAVHGLHYGDLGNLLADATGTGVYAANSSLPSVSAAVGRALVLHTNPDDGSDPDGNGGIGLVHCILGMSSTYPVAGLPFTPPQPEEVPDSAMVHSPITALALFLPLAASLLASWV